MRATTTAVPSVQKPLTREERITLEQQQDLARTVAVRYPTLADAQKGGYAPSTTYVPCIGTHVTNMRYAIKFDPANPSELLYDGTAPESKIVGLSYLVFSPHGPPEGFAGENDFWHTHSSNGGLCMKGDRDRRGVDEQEGVRAPRRQEGRPQGRVHGARLDRARLGMQLGRVRR